MAQSNKQYVVITTGEHKDQIGKIFQDDENVLVKLDSGKVVRKFTEYLDIKDKRCIITMGEYKGEQGTILDDDSVLIEFHSGKMVRESKKNIRSLTDEECKEYEERLEEMREMWLAAHDY